MTRTMKIWGFGGGWGNGVPEGCQGLTAAESKEGVKALPSYPFVV